VANEVVGIDIVARLDGFREELAKIPDIGSKEAKQLASQLSREIKAAERASKRAGKAAIDSANAMKAQARAMSTLTKAVSLGPIIEGAKKLADAFKKGVERAVELDNAVGGDLAASLAELKTQTGGLADSFLVELTPALVASVKVLSDVANGARLAAETFFDLGNEQARQRAATDLGNKAIEAQADKIMFLKETLARFKADSDTSSEGVQNQIANFEGRIAAQVKVLQRLKGELKFGQNLTPGTDGKPAAVAGKPSRAAKGGPDPAKEAEAQAKRVVDALGQIRVASEDYAAALAGDEAVIRLAQRRTVEELQANLATVIDSTVATEGQRLEALAEFKAAEVALEQDTAAQIAAINAEAAEAEMEEKKRLHDRTLKMIEDEKTARHDSLNSYLGTAASVLGSIAGLVEVASDIEIESTREGSRARQKAMKEAWEAQTALAIAQAAINVPLSISQAAAGPWPAAIGFMVAAGAASAAGLVGVIAKAATGPKFHDGGSATDEIGATLLRGEVVLPRPAVRAMGGPDGVQGAVDSARGGSGAQSVTIVQKVGHKVYDVQTSRAVERTGSPLNTAIRRNNPRGTGRRNPYAGI
jgi:hypothetical protein